MMRLSVTKWALGWGATSCIVSYSFVVVVVGNGATDTPRVAVVGNVIFASAATTLLGASFALAVRARIRWRAVGIVGASVALCAVPALVVFQTGRFAPEARPVGPEFDCLVWSRPVYPTIGSWDAQTILCVTAGIPTLNAIALSEALPMVTDGAQAPQTSSPLHALALSLCTLILLTGTWLARLAKPRS
jgi:hypothetical protein